MPSAFLAAAAWALSLFHTAWAASPADWRSRSIYQVMTDRFALTSGSTTQQCDTEEGYYCGGSWKGIEQKLDYIQGMGFDAIWISPITKQLEGNTSDGTSYHGYWQQDIYSINEHFGTASDLKDLSAALHSRGMYLMVDVVFNHYAWSGSPSSVDYSKFNPFNKQSDFHPYCPIDYDDPSNTTSYQQCWEGDTIVPLPDLKTEDSSVASTFQSWIKNLVAEYSIDGFRVDSALEMNTGFWAGIEAAAGVYMVVEADTGDVQRCCGIQAYVDAPLNYATYFPLIAAFKSTSGSISDLANTINSVKASCKDTSLLGTFSENHDQPRFAQLNPDLAAARNVLAFTLLVDGIPIVYEGQEQHYASLGGSGVPFNREAVWLSGYNTSADLYGLVHTLNKLRKLATAQDAGFLAYQAWPSYQDSTTLAVRKGSVVSVLSNKGGAGASYTQPIDGGWAAGTQVTEVLTCATLTAQGSGGTVQVPMAEGQPRIYYPTASLKGSGICGA